MNRDLDLLRQLLFVVEAAGNTRFVNSFGLEVWDHRVQYHLSLLVEANLVRGVGQLSNGAICLRLTWQGTELLEMIREDGDWQRARRLARRATGGQSMLAIEQILRDAVRQRVQDQADRKSWLRHRWWRFDDSTQPGFARMTPAAENGSRSEVSSLPDRDEFSTVVPPVVVTHHGYPDEPTNGESNPWAIQMQIWQGQYVESLPTYML